MCGKHKFSYRKNVAFMTFCTCDFITARSIASYQEIFWSISVEDKFYTKRMHFFTYRVLLINSCTFVYLPY